MKKRFTAMRSGTHPQSGSESKRTSGTKPRVVGVNPTLAAGDVKRMQDGEVHAKLEAAFSLQQLGKTVEARQLFEEVLSVRPEEVRALYSLAILYNGEGNQSSALQLLEKVVHLAPGFALGHYALGSVLQALGRLSDSIGPLTNVLRLQPGHSRAAERLVRAQQSTDAAPTFGEQDLGLGVIRPAQVPQVPTVGPRPAPGRASPYGKVQDAEVAAAWAGQAQGAPSWLIEAFQFKDQGRFDEARVRFELLLKHDPENLLALYALSEIAMALGKKDFALHFANRAIRKDPSQARAHFSRASVLQSMGLYEAALASFDEALRLKPDLVEGWNNRTHLLHAMHRNAEALASVEKALAIRPDDLKALNNRGYLLSGYKRHAEAAEMYERQLAIDPDYEYAAGLLAFARLHACDWRDEERNRRRVIDGVREGKRSCNPLAFFAMSDDPAEHLRCVRIFAEHRFPPASAPLWNGERYLHRKPRLGYVSADFREHPVGHLMTGITEQHDKRRFEVFGFSLGIDDGSVHRRRFKQAFEHFIDCRERTSAETAQVIRAMEIDVLIDLGGYTSDARPDIFAMRPAPIQINYLGFPGTMGMPFMDYILADEVVIPRGEEVHYQEKVLRLPCCYLPVDDTLNASKRAPSRASCGLPKSGTVFCSFNHDYKINPSMWSIWMDLLREQPKSVLWLMKLHEDAMTNLRREAQACDIDPHRLVFATRVPKIEDHLARYRLADVFLDTTPYNAHSTATDVLRAGVPIVTMSGRSFASRVAGSVIKHMGAEASAIVHHPGEYRDAVDRVLGRDRSSAGVLQMTSARDHCRAIEEILWQEVFAK